MIDTWGAKAKDVARDQVGKVGMNHWRVQVSAEARRRLVVVFMGRRSVR